MKVHVKLFAAAKELAKTDVLGVEVPPNTTVSELREAVVSKMPALEKIVSHSLWAIGTEYVSGDDKVTEQSDVALIPPVSGG